MEAHINIFVLDNDITKCAQYHNDRHCSKMILESVQMLSTAIRMCDGVWHKMKQPDTEKLKKFNLLPGETLEMERNPDGAKWIYVNKRVEYLCHSENHPCNIWARKTKGNWLWLYDLTVALNVEKRYRYGDYDHKSIATLTQLHPPLSIDPSLEVTPQPCAMPEDCIVSDDPVENYRMYYVIKKTHLASWTLRGAPAWYTDDKQTSDNSM